MCAALNNHCELAVLYVVGADRSLKVNDRSSLMNSNAQSTISKRSPQKGAERSLQNGPKRNDPSVKTTDVVIRNIAQRGWIRLDVLYLVRAQAFRINNEESHCKFMPMVSMLSVTSPSRDLRAMYKLKCLSLLQCCN